MYFRQRLIPTLYKRPAITGGGSGSLAKVLAGAEVQALALDFTDSFWQSSTGHYGSAYILDTGTPANDYDSHPYGELTYTSPSAKMTLGPTGSLRFGAHNLYLNSASPANQSVTVVSGATYSVDITGSVSVTASGAATGTWTAGSNAFTAATTTLTLGSTSGSGTVVVRRTPSDSTYLATTSAARYALPYEWDSGGNLLGILVEEARTNLVTYSNTFSNAAWTKAGVTVAQNVDSPLGAGTGWTLTTSSGTGGGNGHQLYQSASFASAGCNSIIAKAGTISWLAVATDAGTAAGAFFNLANGTVGTVGSGITAAILPLGGGWYLCSITDPTSPTDYIVVEPHSADAEVHNWNAAGTETVLIALAQAEEGTFPTSRIPTLGSTVTRAADNISLASSAFPTAVTQTFFAEFYLPRYVSSAARVIAIQSAITPIFTNSPTTFGVDDGTDVATVTVGSVTGAHKVAVAGDASDASTSADGSAATAMSEIEIATATSLYFGSNNGASQSGAYLKRILYLPRRMSNAELQTVTT